MKRFCCQGELASAVFFDGANAGEVIQLLSTRLKAVLRPDGLIDVRGYHVRPHKWVILYDNGFVDVMNETSFTVHYQEVAE